MIWSIGEKPLISVVERALSYILKKKKSSKYVLFLIYRLGTLKVFMSLVLGRKLSLNGVPDI